MPASIPILYLVIAGGVFVGAIHHLFNKAKTDGNWLDAMFIVFCAFMIALIWPIAGAVWLITQAIDKGEDLFG